MHSVTWKYNNGSRDVLGPVLKKLSNMTAHDRARLGKGLPVGFKNTRAFKTQHGAYFSVFLHRNPLA